MVSRLKKAERGDWDPNASPAPIIDRDQATQNWTLTQTGNWDLWQSDEDGDGTFTDPGEFNDDRTHNKANEILERDTDDNGTADSTFTHDAAGNTTGDGPYNYEYDAWNRLTKITGGASWAGKKFRSNGLGWRITALCDTDSDGSFDDETVEHYVYDGRWRMVARYSGSSGTPKEQWAHHNAGPDGGGGSSYIDSVVLRQRDATGDATLEERRYLLQNWRADAVALISDTDTQVERVSYDPYGEAFGFAAGDTDFDGDFDSADSSALSGWQGAGKPYRAYADVDLDGDVDSGDASAAVTRSLGRGVLSHSDNANRLGYAGYVIDGDVGLLYHVRYRVLHTETGRWMQRDPAGHVNGASLYEYCGTWPIAERDSLGLACYSCLVPDRSAIPRQQPGNRRPTRTCWELCMLQVSWRVIRLNERRCGGCANDWCETVAIRAGAECCRQRCTIHGPWRDTCADVAQRADSDCRTPMPVPITLPPTYDPRRGPPEPSGPFWEDVDAWYEWICYFSNGECGCDRLERMRPADPFNQTQCIELVRCLLGDHPGIPYASLPSCCDGTREVWEILMCIWITWGLNEREGPQEDPPSYPMLSTGHPGD